MKTNSFKNASWVNLDIPCPGHAVTPKMRDEVKKNIDTLDKLISDHDVIFLLTDTRESRWLPTLLGTMKRKLVITVGLGFSSYVVMRHGMLPKEDDKNPQKRLGCYFCNDVVAPVNVSH